MAPVRVSEAEAVRDFASLLAQVRAGVEVEIEGEGLTIAALVPRHYDPEDAEKGYNEWFGAQIQEALDSDPATDLNDEDVEKHFAKLRDASQLKLQGIPK